jgi:RNA polymerase sigma-70 factor (ECF subfamily)
MLFRSESRFTTWALTIAVRVAFTELRRRRWKDVSRDEMIEVSNVSPGSLLNECVTVETRILLDKIVNTLYDTINKKLTEKQRQTVFAELIHEAPLEEIARRMGTTRNALYKVSHDARRRLRRALTEAGVSGDDVRFALDL